MPNSNLKGLPITLPSVLAAPLEKKTSPITINGKSDGINTPVQRVSEFKTEHFTAFGNESSSVIIKISPASVNNDEKSTDLIEFLGMDLYVFNARPPHIFILKYMPKAKLK
jgi:hypothetical protein